MIMLMPINAGRMMSRSWRLEIGVDDQRNPGGDQRPGDQAAPALDRADACPASRARDGCTQRQQRRMRAPFRVEHVDAHRRRPDRRRPRKRRAPRQANRRRRRTPPRIRVSAAVRVTWDVAVQILGEQHELPRPDDLHPTRRTPGGIVNAEQPARFYSPTFAATRLRCGKRPVVNSRPWSTRLSLVLPVAALAFAGGLTLDLGASRSVARRHRRRRRSIPRVLKAYQWRSIGPLRGGRSIARQRRQGTAEGGVLRRRRRRAVEDHRRRRELGAGDRRPDQELLGRRGRRVRVEPRHRLHRHGGIVHPRQHHAGRRHVQVHRRRQDVDAHRLRQRHRRRHLEDPRPSHPTPTSSSSPCSASTA